MEFVCNRDTLGKLLARAASVAAVKSPNQALQCVIIDAGAEGVTVRATDCFLGVEARIKATVQHAGVCAVEARRAADIVKQLPAGDVTVKLTKTGVELRAGKNARFKLPEFPPEQFPELPNSAEATSIASIEARELLRGLSQGSYAMLSHDDTRPQMQATLIESHEGTLRFVSLDGNRLAMATVDVEAQKASLLLGFKAVGEVRKLAELDKDSMVEILQSGPDAFFKAGDVTLMVKTVDVPFPPYRKLLEATTTFQQSVTIRRDSALDVIRRVGLVASADKTAGSVVLTFSEGRLTVSAGAAGSDGEDVIDCDANFDLKLKLSPSYMADALSASADDELRLELHGERGPVVMRSVSSSDFAALIQSRT